MLKGYGHFVHTFLCLNGENIGNNIYGKVSISYFQSVSGLSGLVTGFAIDKGVDLYFDVRGQMEDGRCDPHVHLESRTFEGTVDFDIDAPSQVKEGHWGDYARGAKYALRKRFELKRGIDGVIQGSLPVGGLSSSAAVLIAYVMAFAKANDITLQPFEVVKIASEAEREYIGLNNGLLDQAWIPIMRPWRNTENNYYKN